MKRFVLAIGLAATSMLVPLASVPATAYCQPDPGTGDGGCANTCPKPIVVGGKEIVRFYCPM